MYIDVYNKINKKNTNKILRKLADKNEKRNFHAIINMHKIKIEKHYDIYAIAAKIARGESVSSDELKYIREHAPGLLEDARKQFRESLEKEREKNIEIKHDKSVNETENNLKKDGESSTKANKDSVEIVNNKQGFVLFNKSIN